MGGHFTNLGGQARNYIGRLNADGSLDTTFNPTANGYVLSLVVQADGRTLVGGSFTNLASQMRSNIGRLLTGDTAVQKLTTDVTGSTIVWQRSGAGPEVQQVIFENSTDATNYSLLGPATRISGGWRLTGQHLPVGQPFYLRARGRAYNGSSGIIQSIQQIFLPGTAPTLSGVASSDSAFQVSFSGCSGIFWWLLIG